MAKDVKLIISGDSRGAEQALGKVKSAVSGAESVVQKATGTLDRFSVALGAIGAQQFAARLLEAQVNMDKLSASMSATFGAGAGAEIAFMRAEAGRLGLAFNSTAAAFGKFAASTKGTVLQGEETREIFSSVSEAATAMGLSVDETSGILLAMSQMVSKGKVSAEELTGQLGERLPGALQLAAKAMGITQAELLKMMQNGEVMASDLLPKLADALHERFGKAAEDASNNAQQALNRFKNAWDGLLNTVNGSLLWTEMISGGETFVSWYDARLKGRIGFFEWMFTGKEEAQKRMAEFAEADKKLAAQKSVGLTPKEMEKAAEEKAKSLLEADEKASKIREKQLEEIRNYNDRILDVEKKRIDKSLKQEEEHLQKVTSAYQAAVTALDSIVDAKKAVQDQLNNRNAADSAKNAFDVDPLNAYLNKQDELVAAEKKIDDAFGMTAEEKAKAYANLIDQAAGYNQAVMMGSTEIISGYQTEYTYQTQKEELQAKINALIEEEEDKRFNAAVALAEQQIDAQEKAEKFKREIENIETVLDRLNNKEINIIFKAQTVGQILSAAGLQEQVGPAYDYGTPGFVGPPGAAGTTRTVVSAAPTAVSSGGSIEASMGRRSVYSTQIDPTTGGYYYNESGFAVGTAYVPRTGLYQLHRGEEVRTRGEVQHQPQSNTTHVTANITINAPNLSAVDSKSTRELALTLAPEIKKILEERYARK